MIDASQSSFSLFFFSLPPPSRKQRRRDWHRNFDAKTIAKTAETC